MNGLYDVVRVVHKGCTELVDVMVPGVIHSVLAL
jgi:hypothetical protein